MIMISWEDEKAFEFFTDTTSWKLFLEYDLPYQQLYQIILMSHYGV